MTRDSIVPPTDDELKFVDSILLNRVDEDSVTESSDEGVRGELAIFRTNAGKISVLSYRW